MNRFLVQVTSVRHQDIAGLDGCIFYGLLIAASNQDRAFDEHFVVRVKRAELGPPPVERGQLWQVSGAIINFTRQAGGIAIVERQIEADTALLVRPYGNHIIQFIACGSRFHGIGQKKAEALWRCYGEALYTHLDNNDTLPLCGILSASSATNAIEAWNIYARARLAQNLWRCGIPYEVSNRVFEHFGFHSARRVAADPYRLLTFSASWEQVEHLAIHHLGVEANDVRRIQGAVEECLFQFAASGITVVQQSTVSASARSLLAMPSSRKEIDEVLGGRLTNGGYIFNSNGSVSLVGTFIIEYEIALFISQRISRCGNISPLPACALRHAKLRTRESDAHLLNHRLWEAVEATTEQPFVIISDASPSEEETVLQAIADVCDASGATVHLVATSGPAVGRIQELTGRYVCTVAAYIKEQSVLPSIGPTTIVVADSVYFDLKLASSLFKAVPIDARIVLLDPVNQLLLQSSGSILPALKSASDIPHFILSGDTLEPTRLAKIAADIDRGCWTNIPEDSSGVITFTPRPSKDFASIMARLNSGGHQNTQILFLHAEDTQELEKINKLCQVRTTKSSPQLLSYNKESESLEGTGFHVGDLIICISDTIGQGVQKGARGVLVQVAKAHAIVGRVDMHPETVLGWIKWDDGELRSVTQPILKELRLAYACSVLNTPIIESQTIIIVAHPKQPICRKVLCSVIRLARSKVVLVGDEAAFKHAVDLRPIASIGASNLAQHLKTILN